MIARFFKPMPWALGLSFVCAQASADLSPSPQDTEARVARAQASASVWTMESESRRARAILQTARERGRATEVGCADEALSRVDTALRVGREHAPLVALAWSRGDVRQARSELARVAIAAENARSAGAWAELCVDEARPAEGTTVRLIIDAR